MTSLDPHMSANYPPEVRERLQSVGTTNGGEVELIVDDEGDVRVDPEAGVYPDLTPAEETSGYLDALLEREDKREQESWANLGRIVGLLAENGFPSEPQQKSALSHPVFVDTSLSASDEEIVAKARIARADLASQDDRADTRFQK